MNRTLTILVALAVLAGAVVPAVAVAQPAAAPTPSQDGTLLAQTDAENDTTENDTDANATRNVTPGAMLAGSIGAQQQEVRGAVEHRAFGLEVAAAATNDSKAQVLAHTQERLQERLDGIQERQQAMDREHANGTISESRYQAHSAEMAVEAGQIRSMANSSERFAHGLPADVLEHNGVNVTAIQQLRTHAENMTGPEVARMARTIAGEHAGQPLGPHDGIPGGPPEGMPGGPPADRPGNQTDHQTNHTDRPGNETMGPGGGQSGPPGEDTNDTNETDETTTTADGE